MFSPKHQFLRDYESSERYHLHALTIREQLLGAMHPHTARSLNSLGELYSAQERYGEAEPLLRRALHIREVSLGSANTDVATVLENLAHLLHKTARGREAQALEAREIDTQWEEKALIYFSLPSSPLVRSLVVCVQAFSTCSPHG